MAQLKDNPMYTSHDVGGYTFYTPTEDTQYHKCRELAMQAQEVYSRCGISKEVLQSFINELTERANNSKINTLRTDIGVIANNLQYRLNNIVDEEIALKMGAIACFTGDENPNELHEPYTKLKLDIARKNSHVYDFFLHLGVACIPDYAQLLRGLQIREYLTQRNEVLSGLTLQPTLTK